MKWFGFPANWLIYRNWVIIYRLEAFIYRITVVIYRNPPIIYRTRIIIIYNQLNTTKYQADLPLYVNVLTNLHLKIAEHFDNI
ncbi:hypothetical protein J2S74_000451 [Evansella vedderi]|uniref:Uncharacterized protein n=1 Tax=Evansella vedderi TaxID=38282 RepID=A0ABT9ZPB3_9BACI|nr:hypothetical protein [Evansella vedderi]MDQ0253079.1 hypothetical protein [Evansella vedderi]